MSVQTSAKYDQTQSYHVYYDLDLINGDATGLNPPVKFRFDEIRNSPYLNSPENYFMSVIRFNLQTPSLPVFIPQIQLGQPDPNKTIYSFTMKYKTYEYQQYVEYAPSNVSLPFPSAPLVQQDLSNEYYYMFSYQEWSALLNQALLLCYTGLKSLVLAGGDTLPSNNYPFLEFDPTTLKYILNADQAGYNSILPNPISIYCNSPMQTLLNSFQFENYGYTGITNGKNYKFLVYNITNTNTIVLPTGTYLQMYQEGSTASLMNPIQSIVFTTSILPVVNENTSAPRIFNTNTGLLNTGNNSNITPVLTDFQVPFSADNNYRPEITYSPAGEYRLIDLNGTSPLSSIEISVFWKDRYGNLHPFLINSGCSASMKIMFRRKDFNATSLFKTI